MQKGLTRRQSQRPRLSRLVLRAARAAPATVVAHLERSASNLSMRRCKVVAGRSEVRMSRSAFEDPRLLARSFCHQLRVLGTRTILAGKFQIVRSRHSGERFMTQVVQRQICRTPASVASRHAGPRVSPANPLFCNLGIRVPSSPNKAPEPTPTSVTPRATECILK